MVPEPGTLLGIYRLTRRIGAGGMGEVWRAEDTRLHRNVAIKLLPASMTGDEESRARLLREARTAGQLYHPNIATIHGIELDGETPYIVMEYVEGESLTQAIGARRLTESQIAEMGRGIADALAEAHAKGIVHRDVKPDNVIVAGNRVKVLDFGIAKRYGDAAQAPPGEIVTEAGVVLGTVSYMSPEQATGKALDGRSDIFSLGVMLYQALTGQLPFRGNSNLETLKQILRSEPAELTAIAPAVSPDLARIVARCLRKPVEERYQSAAELAQDLARVVAFGMMATPPRPVPLPPQPAADSGAITMVQPIPVAPEAGPTVGATKPTLPGLTRPELAVPAATRPAQDLPMPAPPPVVPGPAPNVVAVMPPPDETPPAAASSHMQWIVAGASFVIVLAIAGGFVIAKLLGPGDVARTATAPAGASATAPRPAGGNPPGQLVAPPAATGRQEPARQPAPAQPSPAASIVASAPPAASASPARGGAKASYRAAMDALEAGAWRHLDDQGAIAPAAEAAEPLFRAALEAEPGHASAQLHLAEIALFRRRYDAAQKALLPLLTNDSLSFEERTIASFAYSASAVAPSGNGVKEFETSLDQAMAYYGKQPQFASFARDVRSLVRRNGR